MMNKEQTIGCPSHKIIAHNSNDEEVFTLQDSQYSIFADQRPTSYQPSTIIMVFVVVCGMLPLVFALSSTKLSIFTLVDLVLLATFTVTSRGRKIQLTTRGQLRWIELVRRVLSRVKVESYTWSSFVGFSLYLCMLWGVISYYVLNTTPHYNQYYKLQNG